MVRVSDHGHRPGFGTHATSVGGIGELGGMGMWDAGCRMGMGMGGIVKIAVAV